MVIFHSYVKLPEGKLKLWDGIPKDSQMVFWGTLSDKVTCVKPKRHRLDGRSQQEYFTES